MEPKTTHRYFNDKKEEDFSRQVIDSSIDLPQNQKNGKIVKKWKKEREVKKQFVNNRFVSKEKLKKYERKDKMDIVLHFCQS